MVRPDPAADAEVLLWYRATAAHMMLHGELAEATPHLDRALKLFPSDAHILFSAGCFHERLASRRIQRVVQRDKGMRTAVGGRAENLDRAVRLLRKALDADATLTEARVRLGRILFERGALEEASERLRPPTGHPDAAPVAYYRALFLGAVEETLGNRPASEAAYREAMGLFPRAQSPRLALALIAITHGAGQLDDDLLTPLRSASTADDRLGDPWWAYPLCEGRYAEALLTRLRRAIGSQTP
jgi:tetratricopeptide (TPR) repeat protein